MQKTTKSKVAVKPEKTTASGVTDKGKKVSAVKSTPTEDQIREKAKEIYHQRILRGEMGTAVEDWNKAEKLLKGS
jgi:hypothetical protein